MSEPKEKTTTVVTPAKTTAPAKSTDAKTPSVADETKAAAKTLEADIKEADAPELKTGRVITSEERRLMSNVDEKELSKEDKEALLLDGRTIRVVEFTTRYAVEAASDEAAIEAVKRDPSKFPFAQPTVTVLSRAATSQFDFRTADDYEKRQQAVDKSEAARREAEAKQTDEARAQAAKVEERRMGLR